MPSERANQKTEKKHVFKLIVPQRNSCGMPSNGTVVVLETMDAWWKRGRQTIRKSQQQKIADKICTVNTETDKIITTTQCSALRTKIWIQRERNNKKLNVVVVTSIISFPHIICGVCVCVCEILWNDRDFSDMTANRVLAFVRNFGESSSSLHLMLARTKAKTHTRSDNVHLCAADERAKLKNKERKQPSKSYMSGCVLKNMWKASSTNCIKTIKILWRSSGYQITNHHHF